MKIILDTNILIYAAKSKIDIFSQLKGSEIFTTIAVMDELKKISEGSSKKALNAKTALSVAGSKGLKVLHTKENADDSLLTFGKRGYIIATHDKILAEKLKSCGCKITYIRQKKYLEGLQ